MSATRQVSNHPLAIVRRSQGLTQDELGRRAGLKQGTVSKIECGEVTSPKVRTRWALADALGVEPQAIFPDPIALSTEIADLRERIERLEGMLTAP